MLEAEPARAGLLYVPYRAAAPSVEVPDRVPDGLLPSSWPSPELVDAAASAFSRRLPTWRGEEGPRARIVVAPGCISVERRDLARLERSAERAKLAEMKRDPLDEPREGLSSRGAVVEWSGKSRARMVRTIASLDLREFVPTEHSVPGMVTLTLPGDWLTVCPTARVWKAKIQTFRKRFARAFGRQLVGIWKKEFQRRGAVHGHIFMNVPLGRSVDGRPFRQWLSETWADVIGHPDPIQRAKHLAAGTGIDLAAGLRASDPRRVAVYFTKHSSANFGDKEYQNRVPAEWQDGAGRFWGYWGLSRVEAVVEVPLDDSIRAARIMRRWARAQGTTRAEKVWRSGEGRFRKVRRRVRRMSAVQGFLAVNDGPSFAWQLARALDAAPVPWQHVVTVPF